jgi:hypothetical protein
MATQEELFFVRALYDYFPEDTESSAISFQQEDVIKVLNCMRSGWWDGKIINPNGGTIRGWFPSNYVMRIEEEEEVDRFREIFAEGEAAERWEEDQQRLHNGLELENELEEEEDDRAEQQQHYDRLNQQLQHQQDRYLDSNDLETSLWRNGGGMDDGFGTNSFSDGGGNVFTQLTGYGDNHGEIRSNSNHPQQLRRDWYSNPSSTRSQPNNHQLQDEEDDWIPEITQDGRILYFNRVTGQISPELPGLEGGELYEYDATNGAGGRVRVEPKTRRGLNPEGALFC